MSRADQLRQALEILRQQGDGLGPDVLATIAAVVEGQLPAADDPTEAEEEPLSGTLSERRPVTVMFAEISGYALGAEDGSAAEEMRGLWRRVDQLIALHGGTIDKHMGDVVMAVFGVPAAAENDTERAVRCALAINRLIDAVQSASNRLPNLTTRIGINTGAVSVGTVGSDGRSTVIGDVVNVASRLRELAEPGSTVIGETAYRLVKSLYDVEQLGLQPLKGRQMSVRAYRVLATRPRRFFTTGRGIEGVATPMVGRRSDLEQLQSVINDAGELGRGRFVLVTGEAGVGKSRLAAELNSWLTADGPDAVIFQGRSDQRWQHMPFSVWRDLLTSYFGILDSDAPDVAETRLLDALESLRRARGTRFAGLQQFRQRVRAVARILGLELAAGEAQADLADRSDVTRAQADILEFFELVGASSGPVVIFLEDIHWADADSLNLIEKLARVAKRAPLVIIGLTRQELFDRRPSWRSTTDPPLQEVALRPLPIEKGTELAHAILRPLPDAPDDLIALIVRAAGGNPFYMEELVKVLLDDNVIITTGDAWRLSVPQLDRLRIPDTLTGVLQARLDRLPGIERITLQQAAVVGDVFWDGSIQQINEAARNPATADAVALALRSLEEREMIFRVPLSVFADAQAYQFRHSVLREVAYETVLLRDRTYYHIAAADWLEAHSGDRLAEYAGPIAEHYELAGDRERAAAMYELAGRRADSQQRPGRAADYYGRALVLYQQFPHHIDRRLVLYRSLGQAFLARDKIGEALAAYVAMEQTAEEAGDLLEQARAALALVGIYRTEGRTADMLDAAERAAQAAALTGATVELEAARLAQAGATGTFNDHAEAANHGE